MKGAISIFSITLIIVIILLVGFRLRQNNLDDDLIESVKLLNVQKVNKLLNQGADPNAIEVVNRPKTLWQLILSMKRSIFRQHTAPTTHRSALRLAILGLWVNPWYISESHKTSFLISIQQSKTQKVLEDQIAICLISHKANVHMVDIQLEESTDGFNIQQEGSSKFGSGVNAVIFAASCGHPKIVRALLENGAHPQEGLSRPMNEMLAWTHVDDECLRLLIDHGMDVNFPVDGENAILPLAARSRKSDMVDYLLKHGADIHAKGINDDSILLRAATNSDSDVMRLLIEKLKDTVNQQGVDGETALMRAIYVENLDVVKILLSHGADINLKNNKGDTALTIANKMIDQARSDSAMPRDAMQDVLTIRELVTPHAKSQH